MDGPLPNICERYEIPDFVDATGHGTVRRHVAAQPSDLTWSAITIVVWQTGVLRKPNLGRIHGKLTLEGNWAVGGIREPF